MSEAAIIEHGELILRPAEDTDIDFVIKSWLRTDGYNSPTARATGPVYWEEHRKVLTKILAHAAVLVAVWVGDPKTIIGFAVTEAGKVHFVYVRKNFWRMGVAKRLLGPMLKQENVVFTHRTKICRQLPIPNSWVFNPYEAV